MKKTFLALGLEFAGVAVLALGLTAATACLLPFGSSYGAPAAPSVYELSNPGTAATAF